MWYISQCIPILKRVKYYCTQNQQYMLIGHVQHRYNNHVIIHTENNIPGSITSQQFSCHLSGQNSNCSFHILFCHYRYVVNRAVYLKISIISIGIVIWISVLVLFWNSNYQYQYMSFCVLILSEIFKTVYLKCFKQFIYTYLYGKSIGIGIIKVLVLFVRYWYQYCIKKNVKGTLPQQ